MRGKEDVGMVFRIFNYFRLEVICIIFIRRLLIRICYMDVLKFKGVGK